jgi:hypothetical protein
MALLPTRKVSRGKKDGSTCRAEVTLSGNSTPEPSRPPQPVLVEVRRGGRSTPTGDHSLRHVSVCGVFSRRRL